MNNQSQTSTPISLLSFAWDQANLSLSISISLFLVSAILAIIVLFILWRWASSGYPFKDFEIDQAEIGVGRNKLRFKPNLTDRQVAYAIWVELSTRKIGIPIDFEHDVIVEIYDSWFSFFSVTRDLVKSIPASKVKDKSTQAIINLSIAVLNNGLRPHLTKWQARFRYWYERRLKSCDCDGENLDIDPQSIQKKFSRYEELHADMVRVNESLILYRDKMHEIVMEERVGS